MKETYTLNHLQFLAEVEKIRKRSDKLFSNCMCPTCQGSPIYSHVFQKNGILSEIATEGKVYMFKYHHLFSIQKGELPVSYELDGVNKCFGFYGFCNQHDTSVFADIESDSAISDWYEPQAQYLLAYRTICREVYVNYQVYHIFDEILKTFTCADPNRQFLFMQEKANRGATIRLMEQYKHLFEKGVFQGDYSKYEFEVISLPFQLDLCLATPITIAEEMAPLYFGPPKEDIDDVVNIVEIFPYKGKTLIIMGFLNGKENKWMTEKYNQLCSDVHDISIALQDILFRSEFHCMSKRLYEEIKEEIPLFLEEWLSSRNQFSSSLNYTSNLFEKYIRKQLGF